MKKFWVCVTVVMISLGVVAVMGGCGGGGGGGGRPQTSSAYAGSNMPSVIDSTTIWSYDYLLDDMRVVVGWFSYPPINDVVANASGKRTYSGDYGIDGSGGGTYYETWKDTLTLSDTGESGESLWEGSFDSFVDSGHDYPNTMEGDGSFYIKDVYSRTYPDGMMPLILLVAQNGSTYVNYDALEINPYYNFDYYESGYLYGLDGFISVKYDSDYSGGICDYSLDADLSVSESGSGYAAYFGLLNTKASVAMVGSDSTLKGSGTLCTEGDAGEFNFEGCVDFVADVVWENTNICGPEGPVFYNYPTGGTYLVSTMDARAMYDFGATSDPWCFKYLVDADNDGAYEYSTERCAGP